MVDFLNNDINPQKGAPAYLHLYDSSSGDWRAATQGDFSGGTSSMISGDTVFLGPSASGTFGLLGFKDTSGTWTFFHDSDGDGALTAVFGAASISVRP